MNVKRLYSAFYRVSNNGSYFLGQKYEAHGDSIVYSIFYILLVCSLFKTFLQLANSFLMFLRFLLNVSANAN